jgi:hypothetical protein
MNSGGLDTASLIFTQPRTSKSNILDDFDREIMMRWRISSARIHLLDSMYMPDEVTSRLT